MLGNVKVTVTLPVCQPFDADGIFGFLAQRAIPGVEAAAADRYARTMELPTGPAAFRATWTNTLMVELELASPRDEPLARALVRRLFGLDAAATAADEALESVPAFAPLIAARPGTRLPVSVDPAEMVVRAIVGQQISVAAARTHLARLVGAVGLAVESCFGLTRLFPSSAQIAALLARLPQRSTDLDADRVLRLPLRSLRTLSAITTALADGALHFDAGQNEASLRASLMSFQGVGAWTAGYVAMRALGDPDQWLPGDTGLLSGAIALGLVDPTEPRRLQHRHLQQAATAWSPWRSYAAMRLWQAAGERPGKGSP